MNTNNFLLTSLIFLLISINAISGVGALTGGSKNGKLSQSDDWNDIIKTVRKEQKLKFEGDYAYVGQIVSIFDVCTEGQNFRTKRKLPVYKNVRVSKSRDNKDGERDGFTNIIVGHDYRSYPLNAIQMKRECNSKGKRCRFVEKEFRQDTDTDVSVLKFVREEGSQRRKIYKKIFNKKYYVPECN